MKKDLQKKHMKETYKRDLPKRPIKETYKRDLQKRNTYAGGTSWLQATCSCLSYSHVKRDLPMWKETYKRRIPGSSTLRPHATCSFTHMSKETYLCEKRPTKETYKRGIPSSGRTLRPQATCGCLSYSRRYREGLLFRFLSTQAVFERYLAAACFDDLFFMNLSLMIYGFFTYCWSTIHWFIMYSSFLHLLFIIHSSFMIHLWYNLLFIFDLTYCWFIIHLLSFSFSFSASCLFLPKSNLCGHLWLQHTATHCNTLQHTATHCNTRQHTATHCNIM